MSSTSPKATRLQHDSPSSPSSANSSFHLPFSSVGGPPRTPSLASSQAISLSSVDSTLFFFLAGSTTSFPSCFARSLSNGVCFALSATGGSTSPFFLFFSGRAPLPDASGCTSSSSSPSSAFLFFFAKCSARAADPSVRAAFRRSLRPSLPLPGAGRCPRSCSSCRRAAGSAVVLLGARFWLDFDWGGIVVVKGKRLGRRELETGETGGGGSLLSRNLRDYKVCSLN